MYWYQHRWAGGDGRAMDFIGFLHNETPNLQSNFEAHFSLTGNLKKKASLEISDTNQSDSAEYFCAASQYSASTHLMSSQESGGSTTSSEPHQFNIKNNCSGQRSAQKHQRDWSSFFVGRSYRAKKGRGFPMSLMLNYKRLTADLGVWYGGFKPKWAPSSLAWVYFCFGLQVKLQHYEQSCLFCHSAKLLSLFQMFLILCWSTSGPSTSPFSLMARQKCIATRTTQNMTMCTGTESRKEQASSSWAL